jgi:hypothetical protein
MSLDGLPPDCRVYRVSDPFVESLDLAGAGFGNPASGSSETRPPQPFEPPHSRTSREPWRPLILGHRRS